jgi:hypothetical protein
MHRSVKAAAAIAALSLLAAVGAGAAPRGMAARGAATTAGATMMRGGGGARGSGMMAGPGTMGMRGELPGLQNLQKLDKALTLDTAKERVATALKDWGYAELVVDSVAEYQGDFYVVAKDKASGKPALELYVDADYGTVTASGVAGWNTKYGRSLAWPPASGKAITADEAKKLAQQWLDARRTSVKYELKVIELPGYFSVQLLDGGKLSGLVAVNAYTSQVWYRGARGGRFTAVDGSDEG